VRVPEEAGFGIAKMTMSFDQWPEGKVVPATVDIPVVAEPTKKTAKT
jgi:hypothetical protein